MEGPPAIARQTCSQRRLAALSEPTRDQKAAARSLGGDQGWNGGLPSSAALLVVQKLSPRARGKARRLCSAWKRNVIQADVQHTARFPERSHPGRSLASPCGASAWADQVARLMGAVQRLHLAPAKHSWCTDIAHQSAHVQAAVHRLPQLTELDCVVSGLTAEATRAVSQLPHLTKLRIDYVAKQKYSRKPPAPFDPSPLWGLTGLTSLELHTWDSTQISLPDLASLSQLTSLTLHSLNKQHFPALGRLAEALPGLKELHVHETCELSDPEFAVAADTMRSLCSISGLKALTVPGILPAEAGWIDPLTKLTALEELTLTAGRGQDTDTGMLSAVESIPSLTALKLQGNIFADLNLESLKSLTHLEWITEDSYSTDHFTRLAEMTALSSLSLCCSDVTSAEMFRGLKQLPGLLSLRLYSPVSPEVFAHLPQCLTALEVLGDNWYIDDEEYCVDEETNKYYDDLAKLTRLQHVALPQGLDADSLRHLPRGLTSLDAPRLVWDETRYRHLPPGLTSLTLSRMDDVDLKAIFAVAPGIRRLELDDFEEMDMEDIVTDAIPLLADLEEVVLSNCFGFSSEKDRHDLCDSHPNRPSVKISP